MIRILKVASMLKPNFCCSDVNKLFLLQYFPYWRRSLSVISVKILNLSCPPDVTHSGGGGVHTLCEEMFAFIQKWIFMSSCLNICNHFLMDCNSELTLKLLFFTVFMSHIWKVFDKSSALWGMEISVGGIKPNNQLWIIICIFCDIITQ